VVWLVCVVPTPAHGQPKPVGVDGPARRGGDQLLVVLRGEGFLEARQPRLALQVFRGVIEARPTNLRAQLGALQAMADAGLCEGADEAYGALERTAFDHAKARAALGRCLERTGRLEAAVELYGEAAQLMPYEPQYRYDRALLLARMGRDLEAEAERVFLFGTERGIGYAFLAEAVSLWRRGDPRYLAALQQVAPFRFIEGVRRGATRLESAVVMREGCGWRAPGVNSLTMFDLDLAALSAECLRRSGDAEDAQQLLERPMLRRAAGSYQVAPVLARLHVDRGELDAAERLLAGLPEAVAPVLASRWYLARARGDVAGMAAWATRYREHPEHGVEPLEALVPSDPSGP
jgi:Flp pilus assembly protein TadD